MDKDVYLTEMKKVKENLENKKDNLNILILGPRYPNSDFIKSLCDSMRDKNWKNSFLLEHLEVDGLDLDSKFQAIIENTSVENLIIFAIFKKDVLAGGVEWELGFLEGLAIGKLTQDNGESLKKFLENTFVLIEQGDDKLITVMLTQGGFKKLQTADWNDTNHLCQRLESLAYNKLYSIIMKN